jgi:hypothetical protein
MEVRAKLTIDGTVEADLKYNDVLDLTMNHKNVPDDGTDTTKPSECIGITTVYPTKTDWLSGNQRIAFAGKTVRFFVEDKIGSKVNSIKANAYTLQALTASLTTIMTDAGFGTPSVAEFARTDAAATALWTVQSGKVVAKGVADPNSVSDTDGVDIPFFTFWAFADNSSTPVSGEAGDSEGLNPLKPVNTTAGTKRDITPIIIYLASGTPFAELITWTQIGDVPNALASVLAHEAGHGLGLRHALVFDIASGSYSKAKRCGTMGGVLSDGAEVHAQLFGPVHKEVIKKLFL